MSDLVAAGVLTSAEELLSNLTGGAGVCSVGVGDGVFLASISAEGAETKNITSSLEYSVDNGDFEN